MYALFYLSYWAINLYALKFYRTAETEIITILSTYEENVLNTQMLMGVI